jgi:hypothetical protein
VGTPWSFPLALLFLAGASSARAQCALDQPLPLQGKGPRNLVLTHARFSVNTNGAATQLTADRVEFFELSSQDHLTKVWGSSIQGTNGPLGFRRENPAGVHAQSFLSRRLELDRFRTVQLHSTLKKEIVRHQMDMKSGALTRYSLELLRYSPLGVVIGTQSWCLRSAEVAP